MILNLSYVYTRSLPRTFSDPFIPWVGPRFLSLVFLGGKKSSVFYQLNKYWPFLQVCLPLSWLSLYDMCVYMETGWGQQEGSDQFPKRSGTRLSSLWAIPQKAGIG